MEKIKFESSNNTDNVVIETKSITVSEVCATFRRFLVAAGYDYVDYKYLADVYQEMHGE